ncbi:MAG TPA: histidine kinase, partial [Spirochaetia bacterium]|nr:histidine kinase [Spirochaetia bacterium]
VKFQTRLLFTYSVLVFFLTVVLAITFYSYTSRLFEDNAASTYRLLSSRMSLHLDNLIRPMDFITTNLISDYNFRTALTSLATVDRKNPQNPPLINEAAQTINFNLLTYSILKNFYSIVVISQAGDFFSSNFINHSQIHSQAQPFSALPGYAGAKAARGRPVLVPPHDDPWDTQKAVRVYGLARVVLGLNGDLAFIEVQNPIRDLDSLFRVPNQSFVRILALQSDGSSFYESSPTSASLVSHYFDIAQHPNEQHGFRRDPLTGKSEMVIAAKSPYTGVTVIMILNRDLLLRPLRFVGLTTAGVALLIILFSVLYNWIFSAQLTKPLRLIRERMEETELSNLPGGDTIEHENDEIVALDQSFQRLRNRLDDAVKRELHSQTLTLQSRLDSLQAQVNPHFLYNILTVIAGKGLELGNEEIGEICDAIAGMLRYSTSTALRSATIAEEIEHTRTYLFLMKKRFEERLHFEFDVDPTILDVMVPKIVLQQIVENSINHAFREVAGPMEIRITGHRIGSGWSIDLTDNGQGFDPEVLAEVNAKIRRFAVKPGYREDDSGLAIGGLGLLNTFIRLHLFFRGDFVWRLENSEGGGAHVIIGGVLPSGKPKDRDVQSASRRG